MNKARRKALANIIDQLSSLRDEIEPLAEEERDCYNNLPEGLALTERGEQIGNNADALEQTLDDLDDVITSLSEVRDN